MTSWLQKSGGAGNSRQSCLFESLGRLCLSLELSPERSVKITELASKRSLLSFCISWSALEPLSADDVPLKVVKNISNRSLRHVKITELGSKRSLLSFCISWNALESLSRNTSRSINRCCPVS